MVDVSDLLNGDQGIGGPVACAHSLPAHPGGCVAVSLNLHVLLQRLRAYCSALVEERRHFAQDQRVALQKRTNQGLYDKEQQQGSCVVQTFTANLAAELSRSLERLDPDLLQGGGAEWSSPGGSLPDPGLLAYWAHLRVRSEA